MWLALRADLRVRWRVMVGLAVLLGLVGGVVLAAAAGARRTDTAYPRLRPSQMLGTVLWQASALAAAALLAGLPLGILAGRWAWVLFAQSAGTAAVADIPAPLVLAAIPVTLLLAIVIAADPGWAAARISPATVLRTSKRRGLAPGLVFVALCYGACLDAVAGRP